MSLVLLLVSRYSHRNVIERYNIICLAFTNEPSCIKDGRPLMRVLRKIYKFLVKYRKQFANLGLYYLQNLGGCGQNIDS